MLRIPVNNEPYQLSAGKIEPMLKAN